MELKINKEFADLIPPLTSTEYTLLKLSILDEGCRDPLVVFNGFIIDGHNRYKICQENNIPFEVIKKDFKSDDEAKVWMINNQYGRRNITDGWKFELARVKKEILLAIGREKQKESGEKYGEAHPQEVLSIIDKTSHNTQSEIAADLGWSTGKVAMADKVWKEAEPEVIAQVKAGGVSINQAYKEVKKEENKKTRQAREVAETKQFIKQPAIVKDKDCLDVLADLEPVDLLIADPPYFTDGDFTEHISQCLNKVKITGQAYVFASSNPAEIASYLSIDTHHMILEQVLVWNYNNTGQRQPNSRYTSNYQICFYYRGPEARKINKPADGKHQYACQTINAPDGRIGDRWFKWQKPLELIDRLISNSSNEGDFVFDPFVGSGTTVLSASKLNRRSLGCETDPERIKDCLERGCVVE